jgi:hypothetical protein
MDNKKFEQLIDLIINENEEQARALFHDIVVEKSREIYENIMSEEMEEEGMHMGGQVGEMMDEISAEQEGMVEAEDEEIDFDDDGDEEIIDIDSDGEDEGFEEEEIEDRVTDLEDKLDQLMAEFEDIMSDSDSEDDAEFDDEAEDDGEELTHDMEQDHDEEDAMMEAIALKKVSVTHGDNGVQNRSTVTSNSGQAGMDSRPVKFSSGTEANPTGPKGPSNAYSKGETQVKDATKWKNAPAQNNADLEAAPKPVTKDEAGKVRSPVAETRKSTKRRV